MNGLVSLVAVSGIMLVLTLLSNQFWPVPSN